MFVRNKSVINIQLTSIDAVAESHLFQDPYFVMNFEELVESELVLCPKRYLTLGD